MAPPAPAASRRRRDCNGADLQGAPRRRAGSAPLDWGSGVSVVIPERGDPAMLADCLEAAMVAAARVAEPVEFIVVVNGSSLAPYESLRVMYRDVRWLHSYKALGFTGAVCRGVACAQARCNLPPQQRHAAWPEAIASALPWRGARAPSASRPSSSWRAKTVGGRRPAGRRCPSTARGRCHAMRYRPTTSFERPCGQAPAPPSTTRSSSQAPAGLRRLRPVLYWEASTSAFGPGASDTSRYSALHRERGMVTA
jgi:hypothetical protein